jgi:FAD/FMN-containing dehydrogenase
VIPPGEIVTAGGPMRKDVAGYDLVGLLAGSEGTLGIVTAVWLRLIPAVEASLPIAAVYPDAAAGCAAVEALMGSGIVPACIEYVDAPALAATGHDLRVGRRPRASWSSPRQTAPRPRRPRAARRCARPGRRRGHVDRHTRRRRRRGVVALARRDLARITAVRGGKLAEDIAVPSTGSQTRSAGRPRSGPGTASRQ